MTSRLLYLARHGDAGERGGLSAAGRRQAELLGARLAGVPFASITHSPVQRAAETAAILQDAVDTAARVPGVAETADALLGAGGVVRGPMRAAWDAAGDYVPFVPDPIPAAFAGFFDGYRAEGPEAGWAAAALERFARPAATETHELVVTHAFLVAWFVRDALGAPPERWLGLNAANCGLTVIRYTTGRPPALVQFNDLSHLPPELRWTGFPPGIVPS